MSSVSDSPRPGAAAPAFAAARARVGVAAWLCFWICTWWAGVAVSGVSSDFLPSPWQVAQKLIWLSQSENRIGEGTLWVHAGWSVLRFLSGFLLALAVGVPLGLLMGQSRLVGDLLSPLFNAFRNVPPIAWAPFSLLWFGASFGSQTFVIFTAAFPPILMNAFRGIRLVDQGLINAARMLGAGRGTLLFRVGLRAAIPLVIAGARIGVANGWLALIGAEIVAGPGALTGLGFLILVGQQNLQAVFSIGAMVVIGCIGALFDFAMVRIERRFT
jgi:ABC-type nitrate/sulfonate/bicarbonate transport system permease component